MTFCIPRFNFYRENGYIAKQSLLAANLLCILMSVQKISRKLVNSSPMEIVIFTGSALHILCKHD